MFKRVLALVGAALAVLLLPSAAQAADESTVTVVHGVPGLTVDVYANGKVLIPAFAPGSQFGPTKLPAGNYDIAIRQAGAAATAEPAIAKSITVPANINATVVAHLGADGKPTLSVFVNDVSPIPNGKARVTVRHTAAFGAVDVLAGGSPLIQNLVNPESKTLEVAAGTYPIAVTAAGAPDTKAFSGDVPFEAGTAYFIHAIGDPKAKTFDLIVQKVDGLGTKVLGVSTGSGGLLDDKSGTPVGLVVGLVAVVLALAAVPAVRFARQR